MMQIPLRTVVLTVFVALLFAGGCSSQAGGPDFSDPDASINDPGGNADGPSVDEKLAEEAWQQRLVYHVGPVDLPAKTAAVLDEPLTMRFQSDEAVWATGFLPKVVDADGAELPPELLHHAIVLNMHEENPLCSEAVGGDPIFIATSLLSEVALPEGYGYPILTTDPLEARVVLQNPTETGYSGVFFEVTLVARPMNEFSNLTDVKPMLVEMDPCGHAPMEVEPGAFAERTATYSMIQPSRILAAHAVLSDFGASVELAAGNEGIPFWRSEAELDEAHQIISLSDNPFVDPNGVALKAGEPISLGVTYDNTSKEWLRGAVGGAMVYLAIEE